MSSIRDKIQNSKLLTDGVYSLVRHPIYAVFLHICAVLVFIFHNMYFLILIVIFWIVLSVAMANT
ncbi:isoprenylcysteine carboxylmethyltransferase family protein [Methanobrevibacter millerae]|uniref:isoprenylcysteine carboxylmethyltransferase family protein n=1 Tax=Methanobrevibacter millerae TaxID=230361 RepID=UPI00292E6973|nr:methyltransferase [Methanobrevibacter millerae]